MTILVNNVAITAKKDTYIYCVEITSGSAKLQMKTSEMDAFVDVPLSSVSASTLLTLDLPLRCEIKAVTTGTAKVSITPRSQL